MTEKDYSLLRPFDLWAVQAGAKACNQLGEAFSEFLSLTPDVYGYFRVWVDRVGGSVGSLLAKEIFLLPLCWVEGKPVYPEDVLWQTTNLGRVLKRKAKRVSADGKYLELEDSGSWATDGSISKLSWVEPPPKPVKYWINIYECSCFASKAAADRDAGHSRLDCIEIELPPLKP